MKYVFFGNLAEPYIAKCDSIIDAVDWFYMEANGIAIGFRPKYVTIRGMKVAYMKTLTRKKDGNLNKGIVYAVPFYGLSRLKHLIK